jgi:hypothetical protein
MEISSAAPNAIITDPLQGVIFAPEPGSFGVPYASFSYVSDNGQYVSPPALVTMNVVTAPVIQAPGFVPATGSGFVVSAPLCDGSRDPFVTGKTSIMRR